MINKKSLLCLNTKNLLCKHFVESPEIFLANRLLRNKTSHAKVKIIDFETVDLKFKSRTKQNEF